MKLKIIFKDDSVMTKLIQGKDDEGKNKVIGVELEAPIIEWPEKTIIGEWDKTGDNILLYLEAGEKTLCPNCGEEKTREAFGPNRTNRNGLQGWCIKCLRATQRERRARKLLNEDE